MEFSSPICCLVMVRGGNTRFRLIGRSSNFTKTVIFEGQIKSGLFDCERIISSRSIGARALQS